MLAYLHKDTVLYSCFAKGIMEPRTERSQKWLLRNCSNVNRRRSRHRTIGRRRMDAIVLGGVQESFASGHQTGGISG